MTENPLFWLALTGICLLLQSFYAMQEMACMSFNKVRLHYHLTKGDQRAKWIHYLLNNPSRLFGTTLLGVNVVLQIGSECSRLFYQTMGLSPDLAPITQIFLVLIFAELSPMIAGRRYPEHVAMLGAPILYYNSKIITPFLMAITHLSHFVNWLIGARNITANTFLSRDELQGILEGQDEAGEDADFNAVVGNIFHLRGKTAGQVMDPIHSIQMLPSNSTVGRMRQILHHSDTAHIAIYHRSPKNVVGTAFPRDLLRVPDNHRVRDHARSPWFITQKTPIMQILKQFRNNNQSMAVVLDSTGSAVGILTLDDILAEIFGQLDYSGANYGGAARNQLRLIDRTFPGEMLIADFNEQFDADLESDEAETLGELIAQTLGHNPIKGEVVRTGRFELLVQDASLLGVKKVSVRSVQ